jgi:hypothetical protein
MQIASSKAHDSETQLMFIYHDNKIALSVSPVSTRPTPTLAKAVRHARGSSRRMKGNNYRTLLSEDFYKHADAPFDQLNTGDISSLKTRSHVRFPCDDEPCPAELRQ